tara:strand:- start:379 stop:825 length:447 start_codon:yes stop_codon:yes gene_type:complete
MSQPCPTCQQWPAPKLAVDAAVYHDRKVLLIERGREPFKGKLAFPGGFVEKGENPEDAVLRELAEECGLNGEVVGTMEVRGEPNRDPRGHVVSIVYHVRATGNPTAGDDAAKAEWHNVDEIRPDQMAGDHFLILENFKQLLTSIRPLR